MTASLSDAGSITYVYSIGTTQSPQKIGIAVSPQERAGELQIGSPTRFFLNVSVPVSGDVARKVERCCHALLWENRIRGEWFDVTPEEAGGVIERAVSLVRDGWDEARRPAKETPAVMKPADLKAWRKSFKWNQIKASEMLGCGRRSLQQWEKGENAIPHYIGLACAAIDLGLDEYRPEPQKTPSE